MASGIERNKSEPEGNAGRPESRNSPELPFAQWLLAQTDRRDDIGNLARAAAKDRKFPRNGDPVAVANHVKAHMADGDAWATVRAAAHEWTGGKP